MKSLWKTAAQVVAIAVLIPFLLVALIPLTIVWIILGAVMCMSFTLDVACYGWDGAVVRFKRDDLPFLKTLMPWGK